MAQKPQSVTYTTTKGPIIGSPSDGPIKGCPYYTGQQLKYTKSNGYTYTLSILSSDNMYDLNGVKADRPCSNQNQSNCSDSNYNCLGNFKNVSSSNQILLNSDWNDGCCRAKLIDISIPNQGGNPPELEPITNRPIDVKKTIVCGDPNAINYVNPNSGENYEACFSNECCKYEEQEVDEIDCSYIIDSSELQIEIESINKEIEVLERRKTDLTNQYSYGFTPNTNQGYNGYIPYSNLNADIQITNTNDIFETVLNDAVYRKYTSLNIEGLIETDFDSFLGNPDFSDSSVWESIVDEDGVVSFTLNDVYDDGNDTIVLSHNSQDTSGANLYKEFCLAKGYKFGTFYKDAKTGKQIPFTPNPDNTFQPTSNLTEKCVDVDYITCDSVADIKMVFGSNQWSGFYIPEDDGNTDIRISMDVMLKFDADKLLNDCIEDKCGIPYVDTNSVYDSGCQNYAVFVDDVDIKNVLSETKKSAFILDDQTSQGNWLYDTQSITIWQTPNLQQESSLECCEIGLGGELVNTSNLLNEDISKNINDFIGNNQNTEQLNSDLSDWEGVNNGYNNLIDKVNDCITYDEYTYKGCESNYGDLLTTQKICKLSAPNECIGYTTILQDYEVKINQLSIISDSLDLCVLEYSIIETEIKNIESEIINKKKLSEEQQNNLTNTKTNQSTLYSQFTTFDENLTATLINYQKLLSETNDPVGILNFRNLISDTERKISERRDIYGVQSQNFGVTNTNIEYTIESVEKCITELTTYLTTLRNKQKSKKCCLDLQIEVDSFLTNLKNNVYSNILHKTKKIYSVWEISLYQKYDDYLTKEAKNVLQFMENTSLDVTLEVDNNIGNPLNNKVTKFTTLDSYTKSINPVWKFDYNGGYSGILLEGSTPSINIVKDSVNNEIIERGGTPNINIFEPKWQKVEFTLDDTQCKLLRQLYPNKQFFVGLNIKNENNCETTLLVDNIKIETDINFLKKLYSAENCLSFDISCIIDDKKSWIFSDGSKKVSYENESLRCNPLPSDKKILSFPKPQERYWDNLEYRYTDYSVKHSKLVINNKSATFRIDPANALECDVYNFWKNVDCDTCDTLYSCTTATSITYTNPTGGTVVLNGSSCTSFDCDTITTQLRSNYESWKTLLVSELNNVDLVNNISFGVIEDTKNKNRGSQKVSKETYINNLYKISNVNKYDVDYYLPKSLGVGFDIQKNQCNTSVIEIKNDDDTYTLIAEETNGDLGFYVYSADTNNVCEITSFIDSECCYRINDELNRSYKIDSKPYKWVDGKCKWGETDAIINKCDSDCSYYGVEKTLDRFIYNTPCDTILSANCVDTSVCIKPLEYLDKSPSDVRIKPNFDNMVLSNLIDAKSRQVISGYPLLSLFYQQYKNSGKCGDFTNRLDYDSVFEIMDLIGDYWTDVIEQVVPATTIWDGCQNSGKVYRNSVFDQNKFPYKRYVTNYYDGDCQIEEITNSVVGLYSGGSIELTESCVAGECIGEEIIKCESELKSLEEKKIYLSDRIIELNKLINLTDSDITDVEKDNFRNLVSQYRKEIVSIDTIIDSKKIECENIKQTYQNKKDTLNKLSNSCEDIAQQITFEEEKLKTNFVEGTVSYLNQMDLIFELKSKYNNCKNKNNINITKYNVMFITQMYDSNEYEGDVNVYGNDEWDSDSELLHDCGSVKNITPTNNGCDPKKYQSGEFFEFQDGKSYDFQDF